MKQKIAVTREVFQEVLDHLAEHFDVTHNQADEVYSPDRLAHLLRDKAGVLTTIADRVDQALLSHCAQLKVVCNIAVGYNNIDIAEASKRGVKVTNTPGVLDDTTADLTFADRKTHV